MYKINEIFYSLQGEGANSGRPAVFVRFSGCNLRCPFCDTDHEPYKTMSLQQIADSVAEYRCPFVVLTGGEPSMQTDKELVDVLHAIGCTIAIETNGTRPLPDGIDWVTISPKEDSILALHYADEVKVVYLGQDVEHYLQELQAKYYYLQPCDKVEEGKHKMNVASAVDYCKQHPHWRLSLQTHKLIGIQ